MKKVIKIISSSEWDKNTEYLFEMKGWMGNVLLELPDGRRFPLTIYAVDSIMGDITDGIKTSEGHYFAEPGLFVVPDMSFKTISLALEHAYNDDYFDRLNYAPGQTHRVWKQIHGEKPPEYIGLEIEVE